MSGKNKVEVRIAGQDYTLVGVESEEYIQKVALYIDRKMNEITRMNNKLSTTMASVLTAINVADDYFKSYETVMNLNSEVTNHKEEIRRLKEENRRLNNENAVMINKNTNYQLELVKREAELTEVRNSLEKLNKARV